MPLLSHSHDSEAIVQPTLAWAWAGVTRSGLCVGSPASLRMQWKFFLLSILCTSCQFINHFCLSVCICLCSTWPATWRIRYVFRLLQLTWLSLPVALALLIICFIIWFILIIMLNDFFLNLIFHSSTCASSNNKISFCIFEYVRVDYAYQGKVY